jgi:hypothetical protein
MEQKAGFQADFETTMVLRAGPEKVFPLLCPVLEERWIPGWRAEVLHSSTGLAELGCVFSTLEEDGAERIWVVTRYEPGEGAIDFAQFVTGRCVIRLEIRLVPEGTGTRAVWRNRVRGLEPCAGTWTEAYAETTFRSRMVRLETLLNAYLESC